MQHSEIFNDLLQIRAGLENMMMGGGATRLKRIDSPEEWEKKASALRELYRYLLGSIPEGYEVALDPELESEEQKDGYVQRTVSYMVGPGERIQAYLLVPGDGKTSYPAVITVHPTNKIGREQTIGNDPEPGGSDRAYGLHLVKRGFVTLSYDLLSTHDRQYPGLDPFDNQPFIEQFPEWSGRGKDLWDVARAVDFLETAPEVDAGRIGCMGHSQGGGITVDVMGLEPRIKAGVCNCGDWPFRMSKNPFNRARTGWWIGNHHLRPFMIAGKTIPIDLHEKLALAAPNAIQMIIALNDFQFGLEETDSLIPGFRNLTEQVQSVYDLLGVPDRFELHHHAEGHSFREKQREQAYSFLEKHLVGTA